MPLYNPTTAAALQGTTTNDNAVAGRVGEIIINGREVGAALSLTTGTAATLTSLALTAGDWDVDFIGHFNFGATTSVTRLISSIGTTNNTLNTAAANFSSWQHPTGLVLGDQGTTSIPCQTIRVSLLAPTTIYGVVRADFTISTAVSYCAMRARRVR